MKHKICFVLATEFSVTAFLLNHLRVLSRFYDITVMVDSSNTSFLKAHGINVKVIPIVISRNVNLLNDLKALFRLIVIFNQQHFSSVHSITPKAGLLAMLASWLVRVPIRVHIFTGQVWVTKTGYNRLFLKNIDSLIALLAIYNLVDSPSQHQFLLNEKVISPAKSRVFAKGSISGVDISRFKPNSDAKKAIRTKLNIADEKIVFLFIGRLTTDKGVLDLAQAFYQLNNEHTHLLFVGPDEQNIKPEIKRVLGGSNQNVHFVGHTDTPELYMAMADALCLPSYREGFGTVLIEAAAVGIPAIASRIYGITDAVVDGRTGLLHEPHDIYAIKHHMESLIDNKVLRTKLGTQAKERVLKDFNSDLITEAWVNFYQEIVGE